MSKIKLIIGIVGVVILLFFCMYHYLCTSPDNPHSVMATATDTMEDSTSHRLYRQQYPQHPTAVHEPCQSYQGVPFQPVPGQPGYPAQPVDPAEPMTTSPNHEQPFTLRRPPSYQDATGPAYHLQPMPSSQPAYLLDPLAQPQPNALPDSTDFLAHSACGPEFVLH